MAENNPAPVVDNQNPALTPSISPDVSPMVPDLTSGGVGKKHQITINIWLLIFILIILMVPYYAIYRYSYLKGYNYFFKQDPNGPRRQTKYSNPSYPILNLNINLNQTSVKQYLSLSLQLVIRNNDEITECTINEPMIRDLIISLITKYKSEELSSVTEQNKLKRLLKDAINASLSSARVVDIYFCDFQIKNL